MPHLVDHAARFRRVLQLHRLADAAQPEAPDNGRLIAVVPDRTHHQRHLDGPAFRRIRSLICHLLTWQVQRPALLPLWSPAIPAGYAVARPRSLSSLPRNRASNPGSLSESSPAIVARTTLCGFADPSDFVMMFAIPAASTTARTAPPAMMPVPSGAGFRSTLPAPKLPTIGCGIVVPASGTRIRFFFAASMPFLIADGTSLALPTPKPTTPWPSPTTTSALKLRFLPPLTTFVTRLIDTTVSLMSSCAGSMRSRVRMILEFQSGFAGRVGDGADAPVIEEPAAVEDHPLDPFFDRPLGDRLTHRLGAFHVAAAHVLRERALHRRLDARRRHQPLPAQVVDDLRVNVRHAAEHAQPRPIGPAGDAFALAQLNALAAIVLRL